MRGLIHAGMNVARINFSHGDLDTHARTIAALRRVAEQEDRQLSIMADLQGPKLRVGDLPAEGALLEEEETVWLTVEDYSPAHIPFPHPEVLGELKQGQRVLLDDGQIELEVEDRAKGAARCRVRIGGRLFSRKGVNLPGATLRISPITSKDRKDGRFAVKQGVDFMALSFVRSPDDVRGLRELLEEWGAGDLPIVAKIEKPEALDVFDEILEASDAVMVARGDLGVETPAEEVPFHQKRIIHACNRVGKPVITATQMLQSMMEQPTPTRAEASDVANAILDGTDAVMLSGETAVGEYPVKSAQMMARICLNAEAHLTFGKFLDMALREVPSVTESISEATVEIGNELNVKAILSATMSGTTARMVARHRPAMPIVAATTNRRTFMRLTMTWGVSPVLVSHFAATDEMVVLMVQAACCEGFVEKGDQVVITAGIPFGGKGLTNMLKVHTVGEYDEI